MFFLLNLATGRIHSHPSARGRASGSNAGAASHA
jgi:hypothetical protein